MNNLRLFTRHNKFISQIFSVHITTGHNVQYNNNDDFAKTLERLNKFAADSVNENVTLFDKIINREIPATIIYEDDKCLAFNDKFPAAPIHFLVIPKLKIKKLDMVEDLHNELLGHLLTTAARLGDKNAPEGFRVVINNGVQGCQSIYHLHLHVVGGRQLTWPPG